MAGCFIYDGMSMALDLLILFALIYVFKEFFRILDKGIGSDRNPLETLIVLSVMILLTAGGFGVIQAGPVSSSAWSHFYNFDCRIW